jgi:hypothetical protein
MNVKNNQHTSEYCGCPLPSQPILTEFLKTHSLGQSQDIAVGIVNEMWVEQSRSYDSIYSRGTSFFSFPNYQE